MTHLESLGLKGKDAENLEQVYYQKTIVEYYSEAGMDYEPWSPNMNMHFGYYRLGLNPFDRESLLNEMNRQVCVRLNLDVYKVGDNAEGAKSVIDLGCGVGATARFCTQHYSGISVKGVTIVPWQIRHANTMSVDLDQSQLSYELADYRCLPYPDDFFLGAYAVESSCYDHGSDKLGFLKEAYRVLKPGASLVVADGFRKTKKANAIFNFAYQKVCEGWFLETFAHIDDFTEAMRKVGFRDIVVEDASWRIAPSVLHVPWVSIKYLFTHLFSNSGNKKIQLSHFTAPMMGLVVGLQRKHYGYYFVTAKK